MKRGDVLLVRFPHPPGGRGKKRPVVVVQSDAYNNGLERIDNHFSFRRRPSLSEQAFARCFAAPNLALIFTSLWEPGLFVRVTARARRHCASTAGDTPHQ